jgi:hypothetical protein
MLLSAMRNHLQQLHATARRLQELEFYIGQKTEPKDVSVQSVGVGAVCVGSRLPAKARLGRAGPGAQLPCRGQEHSSPAHSGGLLCCGPPRQGGAAAAPPRGLEGGRQAAGTGRLQGACHPKAARLGRCRCCVTGRRCLLLLLPAQDPQLVYAFRSDATLPQLLAEQDKLSVK